MIFVCYLHFPHSPTVKLLTPLGRWRNNFKLLLSMCEIHFYYYQESLNRFLFFSYFGYNLFLRLIAGGKKKRRKKNLFDFFHYYLFSKWNSFMIFYSQAFIFTRFCLGNFILLVFKWDFFPFLRNFYLRFFYCYEKLRQFLKSSDIFHSV